VDQKRYMCTKIEYTMYINKTKMVVVLSVGAKQNSLTPCSRHENSRTIATFSAKQKSLTPCSPHEYSQTIANFGAKQKSHTLSFFILLFYVPLLLFCLHGSRYFCNVNLFCQTSFIGPNQGYITNMTIRIDNTNET
jgi:hypothetical protein